MRKNTSRIIGLIAIGAAMLVGCSTSAGTPLPAATTAPGGTITAQPTAAPSSSSASIEALIQLAKTASYKATYKVSGTTNGQPITMEQTVYAKPPKMRADMSMAAGAMSMFVLENGTFMCTTATGRATCLQAGGIAAGQADTGMQARGSVEANPDKYNFSSAGTKQIAGQTATCSSLKPKVANSADFTEATMCYSAQGVMLSMQMKSASADINYEATSYSTTVADADFTLPTAATSMPSMPSGIPGLPGGSPSGMPSASDYGY